MKKHLIAIALIGFFIATAQGVCLGANLLQNGDFESINPDMTPAGWVLSPARNTEVNVTFDAGDKMAGSRSLKINVQNPPGRINLLPEKGAIGAPEPGKTYELALWIKAENLEGSALMVVPSIRLNFRPTRVQPMPMVDLLRDFKTNAGWQEISMKATAPDGAREFLLDIMLTQGTVWLDDITLKKID